MDGTYDLLCFSDVRWGAGVDRTQQLMLRAARDHRVYFIQEPVRARGHARLEMGRHAQGLFGVLPLLPPGLEDGAVEAEVGRLLRVLLQVERIRSYALWFTTPDVLTWTEGLEPAASVWDCADEATPVARARTPWRGGRAGPSEDALLERVDLVFTSGQALYEFKRPLHRSVHVFPSSADVLHFARARGIAETPYDQAAIPRPRFGYYGAIDERLDLELVGKIAIARPEWQFVMIGPVLGLDGASLPRRRNLHWLGGKPYDELPWYVAGWDVAIAPFKRDDSTRTLGGPRVAECLAAGKPVVATSVRDVVRPWALNGLARMGNTWVDFVAAAEGALQEDAASRARAAEPLLARSSWDRTWDAMEELLTGAVDDRGSGRDQSVEALHREIRRLESLVRLPGD